MIFLGGFFRAVPRRAFFFGRRAAARRGDFPDAFFRLLFGPTERPAFFFFPRERPVLRLAFARGLLFLCVGFLAIGPPMSASYSKRSS